MPSEKCKRYSAPLQKQENEVDNLELQLKHPLISVEVQIKL